jgi:hypothetical protein
MPHFTEGVYDNIEIVGQGFTKSTKKGTPGFYLTIRPGDYDRTITFWLPEGNEQSVDIMLTSLETLGLDLTGLERFTQLDPRSQNHVSFVGLTISAQCTYETSNGKTYERWEVPFSGMKQPETLDEPSIRKLDAMFGKKLKAKAETAKPKPKPQKPLSQDIAEAAEAPEATDDIPF